MHLQPMQGKRQLARQCHPRRHRVRHPTGPGVPPASVLHLPYHTTKQAPSAALPANVGVFISSIPLPVQVDFTQSKGYREFQSMVAAWKKKCPRIYVWDYERNFDDYLSPFPCLLAMQSRLQL